MTLSLSFSPRFPLRAVSLLLLLSIGLLAQGQTIRYVRVNGTNNNPASATTWATSTTNLQGAINASNSGDQVWVAVGTYKTTTITGPGSRTISFAMKNGVTILGGFAGSGTPTLAQRNPSSLTTVLSGNLGAVGDDADNAYHVIRNPAGLTNTAVLDGFLITGGNADGNADDQTKGGGMFNVNTSPTVTSCVFQRNIASSGSDGGGGGMYNENSNPRVTSCSFQDNTAYNGGGMYNQGSVPSLSNCSFQSNSAFYGGGLFNFESSNPIMTNCSFVSNTARYGGGMSNLFSSDPSLTNCSFQSNSADTGGGIYNYINSDPRLTGCSFQRNLAITGGGMFNDGVSPNVDACTFLNNRTTGSGGGMFNDGGSPTVTNCTFQSNTATSGGSGGGMYNDGSRPTVTNCGFQSNVATKGGGMFNGSSSPNVDACTFLNNRTTGSGGGMSNENRSSPTVTNCTFQSNTATSGADGGGMSNLESNPRLTNCRFQGNSASNGGGVANKDSDPSLTSCNFLSNLASYGGGVFTQGDNSFRLINCVFLSNSAFYGGGLANIDSHPSLTNCSFLSNSASGGGGGIYNIAAFNPVNLTNCVVFGNGGANTHYGEDVKATYSLLEASATGFSGLGSSNNLTTTVSPFVSPTDARLNGCSPAINTGNNAAYTANSGPNTDQAGNPRFFNNGVIDRGAYEYQAAPATLTLTVPSVNTATVGVAFSQSFVASGGTSPYSYSLASGSPPAGVSLAPTGVLSGTPTQVGSFTLTVLGRDATGCSASSAAYRLTVNDSPTTLTGLAATPATVCVGSPVTFTATVGVPTGSYTYTLTNGLSAPLTGSASGTIFTQSLTPSASGAQNFTLTVGANGRFASQVTTLTVNPLPVASLTVSGTLTCAQPSVTLTAGGGTSYTFTSGSGVLGTPGPTNTVVVSNPGLYSVWVASASGCVSTTSTSVAANQEAASVSISASQTVLTCASPTVSLTAVGSGEVRWSTGETSPSISVSAAGTYSVTLTSGSSCSATASVTLQDDLAPPTNAQLSSGTLSCSQTSLTLTASATGGVSYRFSGGTPVGTSQVVVTTAGVYSVTITGANGCSTVAQATVSGTVGESLAFVQQPASASSVAPGASITTTVSVSGSGPLSYQWYKDNLATPVNGQTTATLSLPNVQLADAGSYSVVVTGACGSLTSTAFALQVIPNALVVSLTADPARLLTGEATSLSATVSGGTQPYEYRFLGPGVISQAGATARVTDLPVGVQSFTVVVSDATSPVSLTSSATVSVTVSAANTAPTVANTVSSQTATVGQSYSLNLVSTFTDQQTPNSLMLSASGLPAGLSLVGTTLSGTPSLSGVSTVTLIATDPGSLSASTSFVLTVSPAPVVNTAPTVANAISSQTATVGQPFVLSLAGTFTDQETPNSLMLSASGLPAGLSLVGTTLSGTPSVSVVSTVVLTATDPGSLTTSTSFVLTVSPALSVTTTAPFAITSVTTLSCTPVGDRINITFDPQYAGTTGQPISFSVVNELSATTAPGPYSLSLYADNPRITLSGVQAGSGAEARFVYNWLAACNNPNPGSNTAPTVANAISSQTATVGQGYSLNLAGTFTDQQTPNSLNLSASGLPAGLNLIGTTLSGTPSVSGVSTVVLIATDPGSLSASTSFELTVLPPTGTPPPTAPFAITSVTTLSCAPVGGRIAIRFTPQYAGLSGQPISFSVVNELAPTTNAGPYSLSLYADNPRITLSGVQAGSGAEARFVYNWLEACNNLNPGGNTAPTVANTVSSQTATVGQNFVLNLASTFTDQETPNSLSLSASGLPAGLSLLGTTLSGTPSLSGVSTVTLIATDPGSLSASTSFVLTVSPALSVTTTAPFAITSVSTLSCTPVGDRINISFTPRYGGLTGQPIAFEVVNELAPTTDPAPYALTLYRDNPVLTLKATQTGSAEVASFRYDWLAACASAGQDNTPPRLNSPVGNQTAVVGQGYSLNLSNTFTDQETPNQITLVASGLPAGLSLVDTQISGTPSVSGVSTVALTATDPGSLSASTSFVLTVSPASSETTTAPFAITSVTTMSCAVVNGGQRRVSFTPRYAGLSGQPISFSVVNELAPTTDAGPYTLNLYADNPVITLSARQGSATTTYAYAWLASCPSGSGARSAAPEVGTGLLVVVLGNPVTGAEVEVEVAGAEGQPLRLSLTGLQGQPVSERLVERAGAVERQTLRVEGQPAGLLLLRVSTPYQTQTVKVLKR